MITVREVAQDMGVDLDRSQAWQVGAAVRNRYVEEHDTLPRKELRGKANGEGSHCLAVYPEHYRPVIAAAIRTVGAEQARQGALL